MDALSRIGGVEHAARHRADGRVLIVRGVLGHQVAVRDGDVVVEQQRDLPPRLGEPPVDGADHARRRVPHVPDAPTGGTEERLGGGLVLRRLVHDDDLEVGPLECERVGEGPPQAVLPPVRRHDHRDAGCHVSATTGRLVHLRISSARQMDCASRGSNPNSASRARSVASV